MTISREGLRQNVQAFKKLEPTLLAGHEGQYALLHKGALVEVFPDKESARTTAAERFPEEDFAISPAIAAAPEQLGFLGLVIPLRSV